MQIIGYARVSTSHQDLALQTDALESAGCHKFFTETASGRNRERPELKSCLEYLRPGDQLVVWKLDRLGRSLTHLVSIVEDLANRDIGFKCLTNSAIDTTTSSGRLVFAIFAALAEFERDLIVDRVNAGLAAAKSRGAVLGRPVSVKSKQIAAARKLIESGESVKTAAVALGLNPRTLYRHL
jgi:DNA invertase Pin-like site-specific DNA recombinase